MEQFGAFAGVYAASVAFSVVLDFGSSQHKARELARSSQLGSFHSWLRRRTLIQLPLTVAFAAVASLLIDNSLLSDGVVVVVCFQALASTLSSGCLAAVRALVSPVRAIWYVAAGNFFFLACVAAPALSPVVTRGAIGATGSWAISATLGLLALRGRERGETRRAARNPWSGSADFGLFSLAIMIQPLDVVILGAVAGVGEVGRYAAVARWVQPILLFANAFVANAFPAMAAAKSDQDAYLLLRTFGYVFLTVIVTALSVFVAAPWLVSSLLGPNYRDSIVLLRLLAIASAMAALVQPSSAFLQARGQERFLAIITASVSILGLCAVAIGAYSYGAPALPVIALVSSGFLAFSFARRTRFQRQVGVYDTVAT